MCLASLSRPLTTYVLECVCRCGASSWWVFFSFFPRPEDAHGSEGGQGLKDRATLLLDEASSWPLLCRVTKSCLRQKQPFLCPHPLNYVCPTAKYDFRSSQKKRSVEGRGTVVCVCACEGREARRRGPLLNSLLCSNQQAEPPRKGEEDQDKDCKCSEDVTATPPLLLPCGH